MTRETQVAVGQVWRDPANPARYLRVVTLVQDGDLRLARCVFLPGSPAAEPVGESLVIRRAFLARRFELLPDPS